MKLKIWKSIDRIDTGKWIEINETHLFERDICLSESGMCGQLRRGPQIKISNVTYRILRDVSASILIFRIVRAEITVDVQNGVGTARA